MPNDIQYAGIGLRCDVRSMQYEFLPVSFDSQYAQPSAQLLWLYDNAACHYLTIPAEFESRGFERAVQERFEFEQKGQHRVLLPAAFNTLNLALNKSQQRYSYDRRFFYYGTAVHRFNAVDRWTPLRFSRTQWAFDLNWQPHYCLPLKADSINVKPFGRLLFRFRNSRFQNVLLPLRWKGRRHNEAGQIIRWSSNRKEFAAVPFHRRAFVKAGWRVLARNILTGEKTELGFIDAENPARSLDDVFLPDGDYEISVLTSSLFWKDCADRIIRTISVVDDVEVSPLPLP